MKRRQFLLGAGGVMLGLPFLASLRKRKGKVVAGGAATAKRMVVFFTCNGVNMDAFWPDDYGALTAASFNGLATAPLGPWASKLLIPRGIHMVPRGFGRDGGGGDDHGKGMAHKLTARLIQGEYASGQSVDQFAAERINNGNPSLTLKVGGGGGGVLSHISYNGANQPVTAENNPFFAYQDLIGGDNGDAQAAARLLARRESVLDLCGTEYEDLLAQDLSTEDRNKLDMHFTAVRDLEEGLAGTCAGLDPATLDELMSLNAGSVTQDSFYRQVGRLTMDVLAIGLACGRTNVATVQWGNGAEGPRFTWDGMSHQYNHHKLSHGEDNDNPANANPVDGYEQMLFDIDNWYAKEFAYLLEKLNGYTEGDGTVLDNSVIVWANELSQGKAHDYRDLPFVIAGSAGGYLKQGQYIKVVSGNETRVDGDAPHNKLLTTMLNSVGVTDDNGDPIDNFGDPEFGEPGEITALKA